MMYRFVVSMVMLVAVQTQAAYRCGVRLQDDIVVTSQYVQISGSRGNLLITPQGDVQRNGQVIQINKAARKTAMDYQAALRRDLPWAERGAREHLKRARVALDKVIAEKLGSNSKVRNRLATLDSQLKQQIKRIIEQRKDGLVFHHQVIDQVRQEGERMVQNSLGGVVQDSLNELGTSQTLNGDNPLQSVMNNLGGLQRAIEHEWSNQEQDFQHFGHEVCQRMTALEAQRIMLLTALPQ
ncbi:DUF2884 family protein [Enterobacteriaceae bacterium LUAb1]